MNHEKNNYNSDENITDPKIQEFEDLFKKEIEENSEHNDHVELKRKNKLRFALSILVYILVFFGVAILVGLAIKAVKGATYTVSEEEAMAEILATNNDIIMLPDSESAKKIKNTYPDYIILYETEDKANGRHILANVYNKKVKDLTKTISDEVGNQKIVVDDEKINEIVQGIDEENWLTANKIKLLVSSSGDPNYDHPQLNSEAIKANLVTARTTERVTALASAINNFIIYLIACLSVGIMLRQAIVFDYKRYRRNRKKSWGNVGLTFGFVLLANIIAVVLQLLISAIFKYEGAVALNQFSIEQSLKGAAIPFMVIPIIIGAPVVEELIFRKSIFSLTKNKWVGLAISSLGFGLLHTLGDLGTSFAAFIYNLIPYTAMGVAFGLVYIRSKENVFVTMLGHGIYNSLSLILIFLR